MDAITLLKDDHKTVEKLFKAFEKAGERAQKTKRELVDEMIRELSAHAAIEEQIFYPAVRRRVPEEETATLEALEEHHVVKWVLAELEGMDADDERFGPKVHVMIEMVRHHVQQEESDLFPTVRSGIGRKELQEIGESLTQAKKLAPHRPHPRSPEEPPANIVAGAAAGAMDRVFETVGRATGR